MTKSIAVLTSGGDAPGMNSAIRAVVRTGLANGWNVYGVRNGYQGLINGQFEQMSSRDVGGILQRGGTILGSARCEEFVTVEGRTLAEMALKQVPLSFIKWGFQQWVSHQRLIMTWLGLKLRLASIPL